MIAAKRLADYKEALRRATCGRIDAPGTYGWILHQDAKNVDQIGRLPGVRGAVRVSTLWPT